MKQILIAYTLKGMANPTNITRKIYGYLDHSNTTYPRKDDKEKYVYKRPGFLSDIKHTRVSKCSFWIDSEKKDVVFKKLKELKVEFEFGEIDVLSHSFERLNKKAPIATL